MEKIHMTTLSSVLEKLRMKKQDNEFEMKDGCFTTNGNKLYCADDLTIVRTYRFEGESDPADSVILYLIEAKDGLMGYTMDVYGAGSNKGDGYDDFIKLIKVAEKEITDEDL